MNNPLFAQAVEAVESFTVVGKEFGFVAALLLGVLVFGGFVLWKLGGTLVYAQVESNKQVAAAVDKISESTVKSTATIVAINATLDTVKSEVIGLHDGQSRQQKAMKLALDAAKTEDPKDRHRLIDDARRVLEK